jgi:Domain of Unknown Function (DUF928)
MNARLRLALALGVTLAPGAPALPQDTVQYRPPAADLAPRRVGGNARSVPASLPSVAVLAPDHLALTVSEQPTLFWYLSAPTKARIEIVVVDPRRPGPLVEAVVLAERAGVQAFELARYGVRLEPGVAYEWSVAVVADPAQRSRDVVAGGVVQRMEPSAALQSLLADTDAQRRAGSLAAAGIWYDALAALSGDPGLRASRAGLLDQAGLADVAAFERRP